MLSDPSWSREIIYKFYFYNLFLRQQIFGCKITRFQSGVTESHRKRILLQRYPKPTSDNISKRYRNSLYSFVRCLFVFSDWTTVLVKQLGLNFERISKWSDSVTFKWFSDGSLGFHYVGRAYRLITDAGTRIMLLKVDYTLIC